MSKLLLKNVRRDSLAPYLCGANSNKKIMKRKLIILAAATSLLLGFNYYVNGAPLADGGVVIVINPKPISHPTQPRTPAYNPFYAELTELGVLLVTDSDWGDATVTLSSIEGDYYQTTFEMSEGSILLPINGDAGDSYTLTISLGSLGYEGSFVL